MTRPSTLTRALRLGAAALVLAMSMTPGAALARSSGGYSRPSISISRPSVRTPSVSIPSRPSSGGYARPADRTPSILAPSRSAGDIAVSRKSSADALRDMQERRRPQADAPSPWTRDRTPSASRPDPAPRRDTGGGTTYGGGYGGNYGGTYGGGYSGGYSGGSNWGWNTDRERSRPVEPPRPRWGGDPSWVAPSYVNRSYSAGAYNPLMLWFLLDTMSRPGHSEWFRQHRDDPGYREWRRQADASAASNPDLKSKLDQLDSELGAPLSGPRDENYLPPGVSKADAVADEGSGLFGKLLVFLFLAALVAGGIWFLRNRTGTGRRSAKPGIGDVASAATRVAKGKLGIEDEPVRRDPFRIGHVIDLDPSPFILGGEALRTKAPEGGKASVTAVGELDGLPLTRLHLGDGAFVQVHLSDTGAADECRYFALMDEVQPADADEWLFWLPPPGGGRDPKGEWMIGFPVFETQDGTRWDRVWSPGERTVPPVEATEVLKGVSGITRERQSAMLFARETGVETPAREYLLIVASTGPEVASVRLHTGIDVEPGTLNLTN